MPDQFSPAERSAIMARVKATGNKSTEGRVETALLAADITGWEKHPNLPGTPDFYFPRQRVIIFVDGCQWHACPQHVRYPQTNTEYWRNKIDRNRRRDNRIRRALRREGYHVLRVWEHELKDDRWLKRLRTMLRRSETMTGPVLYHGRRGTATFTDGQPAFFTSDLAGARWYAQERGSWEETPQIYAANVTIHQPAQLADAEAAIARVGATEADVAAYSPYEGENILDFLYVPTVQRALEDAGFDGYTGWDVLTNGEIPVTVVWHPEQIMSNSVLSEQEGV